MIDIVDNLVQPIVKLAAHELSDKLGAVGAIEPYLGGDHGSRLISPHAVIGGNAAVRIQAGGDVDGNHARRTVVQRRDPDGKRRTDLSVEAGSQNRIDSKIGFHQKSCELIARGTDDDLDIAPRGTTRNMARQSRRNLIGLNGRHDDDMDIMLLQDVGRNPAVAAVVAEANKNNDLLRMIRKSCRSYELARMLHKLCFGRAFTLDDVLELDYFFGTQNRLHISSRFS